MSSYNKCKCITHVIEPDSEPPLVLDYNEQASIFQVSIVSLCFNEPCHFSVALSGRKPGSLSVSEK